MAYTQEEIFKLVEEEYIQLDFVHINFCDCDDCTSAKWVRQSRANRMYWGGGVDSESDEEESSRGGAAISTGSIPDMIQGVMLRKNISPDKILDLNLLESSKYTFNHSHQDEMCVHFYGKFNMNMSNIIFPNNTKIFDLKYNHLTIDSISSINMPDSVTTLKINNTIPLMSLKLPNNITHIEIIGRDYNFPIDNFPKTCTHLICGSSPLVSFKNTNIVYAKIEFWFNNVIFPKLDTLIIDTLDAPIVDNQIKNLEINYCGNITNFNICDLERLVISKPSAPLVDLPPTLKYLELGTKKYGGGGFIQLIVYGCGDVTIQGDGKAKAATKKLTKEEIIERSRFPSGCDVHIYDF